MLHAIRQVLLAVVVLITTGPTHAQVALDGGGAGRAAANGPILTLDQVIRRVRQENLSLQVIRKDIDAAQALRYQASLRPNPTFSFEQQRIPGANRAYSSSFSVPIELGGKRAARIAAADSGTRAVQADVDQKDIEIRSIAIQTYFDVLSAQDRLELAQASMDVARRATDVAEKRVRAGRVSPVDEARAKVAQATSQIELSQATADLETGKVRLSALWGGGDPTDFTVQIPSERLPPLPAEQSLQQRLGNAPGTVRARAEVERRESLVGVARSLAVPEFAVNVGTGTLIETGQRSNQLGLSVSIPIFDRNQGNISEARIRADQARQELRVVELSIRTDVVQAKTRLAAARRDAELAQGFILPEANRTLEATTRGFELGKFGFLDVLDAQRTLFASRGQLLRALSEAYQAAAEIERLLGPAVDIPQ